MTTENRQKQVEYRQACSDLFVFLFLKGIGKSDIGKILLHVLGDLAKPEELTAPSARMTVILASQNKVKDYGLK